MWTFHKVVLGLLRLHWTAANQMSVIRRKGREKNEMKPRRVINNNKMTVGLINFVVEKSIRKWRSRVAAAPARTFTAHSNGDNTIK